MPNPYPIDQDNLFIEIIPEELPKGFNQGFKYEFPNLDNTIEIHKQLWNQVKQQVENRGLKLGVDTELPQKNK